MSGYAIGGTGVPPVYHATSAVFFALTRANTSGIFYIC
jgi:hypothetical protein